VERYFKGLLWWWLRFNSRWVLALGRCMYGLEIHGGARLPLRGPLIVVTRHSSRIEIFGLAFLCSALREFAGVAAGPVILNNRLLTWLSQQLGLLPGFKERGLSTASLMESLRLIHVGKVVVMFADGEVPWDGRPQLLRSGAAWLALHSHAPVVVSMLQGTYDIWPRWASRPHLTGKLVLKIGKPFYLCDAPCNRVTDQMLRDANRRLLAELESVANGYMLRSGATKEVGA
jgi:1-acyl-sn-glycerol-3-phosphate acyltransferase